MRFDRSNKSSSSFTGEQFLNNASEEEIGKVIRDFGEEQKWRSLARSIVIERREKKIRTVFDLIEVGCFFFSKKHFFKFIYKKKKTYVGYKKRLQFRR